MVYPARGQGRRLPSHGGLHHLPVVLRCQWRSLRGAAHVRGTTLIHSFIYDARVLMRVVR